MRPELRGRGQSTSTVQGKFPCERAIQELARVAITLQVIAGKTSDCFTW